jgi:hypothetical protein
MPIPFTSAKATSALLALALGVLAATASAKSKKQHTHEHGAAKVAVAVDGNVVTITAEIPGDGVFGFEHAPRNDKEKAAVASATDTLRNKPDSLFVFDAALACKATGVSVKSSLEAHAESHEKDGEQDHDEDAHADVDADYTFTCKSAPGGTKLRLGLLAVFPRVKRVDLQVLGATKQAGAKITSADQAIDL